MIRRTLNTEIASGDPNEYDPVRVAHTYAYEIPVRNGATYLDLKYVGWARRCIDKQVNMRDKSSSILAIVHGDIAHLMPEIVHWSDRSLIAHGFIARTTDDLDIMSLNLQWFFAIENRINEVGK